MDILRDSVWQVMGVLACVVAIGLLWAHDRRSKTEDVAHSVAKLQDSPQVTDAIEYKPTSTHSIDIEADVGARNIIAGDIDTPTASNGEHTIRIKGGLVSVTEDIVAGNVNKNRPQ